MEGLFCKTKAFRVFCISNGLSGLRVEGLEVEFAGGREDGRVEGRQQAVAPGALRLAAGNRLLRASRKPLVSRVFAQATMPSSCGGTVSGCASCS